MRIHTPSQDPRLVRALELKGREASRLRSYPNVTGIGVGFKEVNGKVTDQVALRVYVEKKIPREELAPEDILPTQVGGMPIDVIEGKFRAHDDPADHQIRHQLLKGGISIGNLLLGGSGTISASVFDNLSGQQMVLSNWHVLCGRLNCRVGEPIIQPGNGGADGGGAADLIARLARWRFDDQVDAALAVLSGQRFCTDDLLHLGRVSTRVGSAVLGMHVMKSGRTTGVTDGKITDVSADITIDYQGSLGVRDLRNQLIIKNGNQVSLPGDSGSLWVDDDLRAVGLNFAGQDDGTLGIANPIGFVIEALEINFGPGVTLQDYVVHAASF
jgi:hypothetical protein